MDALLPHQVRYDVAGHIPISVIAESLVANGKLAMEAAFLLEALIPGMVIERAEVSVRRISHESPLQQAFVVAVVAAFQKDVARDVPLIFTDITGLELPERYHTLLTVIVLMIAIYGISKAIERLFPARKTDRIEENSRNLTVVAGDLIQMPPAQIEATIRGRLVDKKQTNMGMAIRNFFAPTIGKDGATIVGGVLKLALQLSHKFQIFSRLMLVLRATLSTRSLKITNALSFTRWIVIGVSLVGLGTFQICLMNAFR
jgi:hypothetical protein